jgi:lysylphosphatidylglycerol synthetase-like protein (DUF2156 family)
LAKVLEVFRSVAKAFSLSLQALLLGHEVQTIDGFGALTVATSLLALVPPVRVRANIGKDKFLQTVSMVVLTNRRSWVLGVCLLFGV